MAEPADLNTVHNPSPGGIPPAAWGDLIRDWTEFLASQPRCSVSASAAQSVPDATLTPLTANTEEIDTDSMHTGSSPQIKSTTVGTYTLSVRVKFGGVATGNRRYVGIRKNGATTKDIEQVSPVAGGNTTMLSGSCDFVMALTTDYVEAVVIHDRGSALDVTLEEFSAKRTGR